MLELFVMLSSFGQQVTDLSAAPFVKRELALIKVRCDASQRRELSDLAAIFHGSICDVSLTTVTLEMQGKETKMAALQGLLEPYGMPNPCPRYAGPNALAHETKDVVMPCLLKPSACSPPLPLPTGPGFGSNPRTGSCRRYVLPNTMAHRVSMTNAKKSRCVLGSFCSSALSGGRHPGGGAHGPRGAGARLRRRHALPPAHEGQPRDAVRQCCGAQRAMLRASYERTGWLCASNVLVRIYSCFLPLRIAVGHQSAPTQAQGRSTASWRLACDA